MFTPRGNAEVNVRCGDPNQVVAPKLRHNKIGRRIKAYKKHSQPNQWKEIIDRSKQMLFPV